MPMSLCADSSQHLLKSLSTLAIFFFSIQHEQKDLTVLLVGVSLR